MDENNILIKIATDISEALAGFTETTQQLANIVQQMLELQQASDTSGESLGNVAEQMGELQSESDGAGEEIGKVSEAITEVGDESATTEEETKGLWATLIEGMTSAEVGAVAMGKQLSDAFDKAKDGLIGLVTGFPAMIPSAAVAGDEMLTMSNRLGVSVENLSELKFIAGQSGANMEGMARAMQGLGGTLADASSKGSKAVKSLGLSVTELKAQDPKVAFLGIIDAIHRTVPAAEQGAKAMEVFGARFRSNTMLVKEDVKELHATFEELGGGMTTEMAKASDEFSDNWKKIELVQENFKQHVANYVLIPINAVLKEMPKLGGAMLSVGQYVMQTAKGFLPLAANVVALSGQKGIGGMIAAFSKSTGITGLLTKAMTGLALASAEITIPIGLLIAAVVALGVVLYKMAGGWDGIMATMQPAIQFFMDLGTILMNLGPIIKGVFDGTRENMTSWKQAAEKLFNMIVSMVHSVIAAFERIPIIGSIVKVLVVIFEELWEVVKKAFGVFTKLAGVLNTLMGRLWKDMADGVHETAEGFRAYAKGQEDAAEATKKMGEAAAEAAKGGMNALMQSVQNTNLAYERLSATQKTQIAAALKVGKSSSDIAKAMVLDMNAMGDAAPSVEELTGAIDRVKKGIEDAKKAAADSPWAKMQKEASELATALTAAEAAGTPAALVMDEFGKKASEAVKHAATLKGGMALISAETAKLASTWEAAQLADKISKVTEKATELAKTFSEKMVAGAKAATAATQTMADEMRINMMSDSDAKMARIDLEEEHQITSIENQNDAAVQAYEEQAEAARKAAADKLKIAEANAGPAGVSEATRNAYKAEAEMAVAAAKNRLDLAKDANEKLIAMTRLKAAQDRAIALKDTGDFEKDMALRGITTKKAAQEHLRVETEKLDKLKALNDPFYADQIAAQQRVVDEAELGNEKILRDLGITSKKAAEDQLKIEEAKLQKLKDLNDPYYAAQIKAQKEVVKQMKIAAGQITVDWGGALGSLTTAFEQMANIGGDSFKGIMKGVGEVTGGLNGMKTSFDTGMKAFKEAGGPGGKGGFAGIGQAFTSGMGPGKGGALGAVTGLMKGLGTIVPMAGAVIAGVTMAIQVGKKVWDAVSESQGEKVAKEVGKNFGTKISEEAGDAIAKNAKEMFGGDRFTAEIYNMKSIVASAGGITEKNFSQMADRLGEVFHLITDGKMTVEQATKTLSENFGAFADHVLKTGKIATKQFTDIIALQQQFGTKSKEITDFVASQTTRLGTAMGKLMGPMTKNVTAYTEAQEAAKKATEDLQKAKDSGDDTDQLQIEADKLNNKLLQTKKDLEGNQVEMQRFERLTVAGFNAAIKNGVNYLDAIESMGPALDQLGAAHEALGTKGSAAIQELMKFREVAAKNKELVESAGSLNEIMLALSNTGSLTADTMADLQAQGMDTFTKLTTAGFTEGQSLQQMKGFLEGVRDSHKELGIPIDENTQKLINQAEKEGILSKEQLSTNDLLQQGLGAVIEALGGKLPPAWAAAAAAAKKSSEDIGGSIDKNVTAPAKKAADTLDATNWKGYASKAEYAAKIASDKLGGTAGAAQNVDAQLAATNWDAWERNAVEAANNAKEAIDGVSLGTSPGGIKEIPIKIAEAIKAFHEFEKHGVGSAEDVKDAIDDMQLGKVRALHIQASQAALDGEVTVRDEHAAHLDETLRAIHDAAQAPPINFAFDVSAISADGMKQAVEQQILPLIVGAVDRNNRGSLTKFRQLINPKTK